MINERYSIPRTICFGEENLQISVLKGSLVLKLCDLYTHYKNVFTQLLSWYDNKLHICTLF